MLSDKIGEDRRSKSFKAKGHLSPPRKTKSLNVAGWLAMPSLMDQGYTVAAEYRKSSPLDYGIEESICQCQQARSPTQGQLPSVLNESGYRLRCCDKDPQI